MPANIAQRVALCGNLSLMETHGTGPEHGTEASKEAALTTPDKIIGAGHSVASFGYKRSEDRREITCSDCGHVYAIALGQQSGHCKKCGNIEFLPLIAKPRPGLGSLTQEILSRRVLPRLESQIDDVRTDPLASFRTTPDGQTVEALRMRFQVEWQLWAMLVRNFHDHSYHMAYVCQCASLHELAKAASRYREHRNVMALSADTRWQAEVAEQMLVRVESIAAMRLNADHGTWWTGVLARFYLMKTEIGALGVGWIVLGLILSLKLLSVLTAR
jgi:hypothetical protein